MVLAISRRQDKPFPPAGGVQENAGKGKTVQAISDNSDMWRPVIDFNGRYVVSSEGQVKSLLTGRILSPGRTSRGYLSVSLYRSVVPKQAVSLSVHRVVWNAFVGPVPAGMQINHIDGDKLNNRLANLECVTQGENIVHAIGHIGVRRYRGQEHANAKLAERDIVKIKQAAAIGFGKRMLARAFRVSDKTIANILNGTAWAHNDDY